MTISFIIFLQEGGMGMLNGVLKKFGKILILLSLFNQKYCHSLPPHCASQENLVELSGPVKQKILIMTPAYNHPNYIALQHTSLKKFIQEDYEFVVFNDATDKQHEQDIAAMCSSLNIECIRVPQENRQTGGHCSGASYRHGQAIEYMMETIGFNYKGIVILIDSDMFPIKKFSVVDYLNGHDIAGIRQNPLDRNNKPRDGKEEYMWPGLIFFNMNTLPNKETMKFVPEVSYENDFFVDSGGSIYHYFQTNESVKKLFFKQEGRLIVDSNQYPKYFFPSWSWSAIQFLKCSSCQKDNLDKCEHKEILYKELGFRNETINCILSNKVPSEGEFLIEDTFFHIGAGSNYNGQCPESVKQKDILIGKFIDYMMSLS